MSEAYIHSGDMHYQYEMSREDVYRLTSRLIEEKAYQGDDQYKCYRIEGFSEYSNLARQIERQVFEEKFGNDAEEMEREYGPYEEASTFFLSVDVENAQPVGALRIIRNTADGLKTLNDLEANRADLPFTITSRRAMLQHRIESLKECWDIGTVAVPKEYRHSALGADVSIQLYRGMYVSAMQEEVKHFVSIIDDKAHAILTEFLGIPFVPLCDSEPFEYLGSKAIHATYGFVPDFYENMNRRRLSMSDDSVERCVLDKLVQGDADHTLVF